MTLLARWYPQPILLRWSSARSLLADTDNPMRDQFAARTLGSAASHGSPQTALARVQEPAPRYLTRASRVDYPLESSALAKAATAEVSLHHVAAFSLWRRAVGEQAAGPSQAFAAAAAAHIGCSRAAVQASTVVAELLGPSFETDAVSRRALSAALLFGAPALSHERLLERFGV